MSVTRVELMASAAGKIGGVTWHHLFLVAHDDSGTASYLRAGPQCLPLKHLAGRITVNGDALADYEPPPAGPYGVITFSSGSYEPGGIDFDPVAANSPLASGAAAEQLWGKVQQAAQALQGEEIPYDPIGRGANWALMEALRRCSIDAPLPPKRWVPGARVIAIDTILNSASTRRINAAVVV